MISREKKQKKSSETSHHSIPGKPGITQSALIKMVFNSEIALIILLYFFMQIGKEIVTRSVIDWAVLTP